MFIVVRWLDRNGNVVRSFGPKFSERFFEILKPTRFVTYGTPSAEVKDAVVPFNPVYISLRFGWVRDHRSFIG